MFEIILDKMEDRGHDSKVLMKFVSHKLDVDHDRVMSESEDTVKLYEEQLNREMSVGV